MIGPAEIEEMMAEYAEAASAAGLPANLAWPLFQAPPPNAVQVEGDAFKQSDATGVERTTTQWRLSPVVRPRAKSSHLGATAP